MITIRSLDFSYRKNQIINGLDWSLMDGQICGLLGKNGAGKTTLLHTIAGLLEPDAGSIEVNGFRPFSKRVDFKRKIFLVPESFYLPNLSIDRLVHLYSSIYPSFDPELFEQLLIDFELQDRPHWKKLSFGQRKKLLLALGISTQTPVLLLDEPTNGLDIPSKLQLNSALSRKLDKDKIIIISTHHVRDVEALFDTIAILDRGRIQLQCSIKELAQIFCYDVTDQQPSEPIFAEHTLAGYQVLSQNRGNRESQLDLEFLYKAYHDNSEKIIEKVVTK